LPVSSFQFIQSSRLPTFAGVATSRARGTVNRGDPADDEGLLVVTWREATRRLSRRSRAVAKADANSELANRESR
jgi:hypothetical protein